VNDNDVISGLSLIPTLAISLPFLAPVFRRGKGQLDDDFQNSLPTIEEKIAGFGAKYKDP
jgi:hypothetical protein